MNLFNQFNRARYSPNLTCALGIGKGDKSNTTCVTRYRSFEFLVMLFVLTNASTTFYILINKFLQPFLNNFVVICLDNIVVYNTTLEEHV